MRHALENGAQIFIFAAQDTIGGRPLTLHEKLSVAMPRRRRGRNSDCPGEHAGLHDELLQAVGMKVMVTLNIQRDALSVRKSRHPDMSIAEARMIAYSTGTT